MANKINLKKSAMGKMMMPGAKMGKAMTSVFNRKGMKDSCCPKVQTLD